MAHLRPLTKQCSACGAVAKFALYNRRNALMGEYCRRHAGEKLRRLEREENAERQENADRKAES